MNDALKGCLKIGQKEEREKNIMSTYYFIGCEKCKEIGGFYSKQAWGWGNMDIVETFKFLAFHTEKCGHENIKIISEHDDEIGLWEKRASENEYFKRFIAFPKNSFVYVMEKKYTCDDHWVVGVYSTEAKAKAKMKELTEKSNDKDGELFELTRWRLNSYSRE